jgi:hypothetical protein
MIYSPFLHHEDVEHDNDEPDARAQALKYVVVYAVSSHMDT